MLSAVDPGEGPLRQVKEGPVVAEEEARGIALLEPLELPARQPALAHQDPDQGLPRTVLGLGPSLAVLVARDQPDQRQLIDERLDIDFGHGELILTHEDPTETDPADRGRERRIYRISRLDHHSAHVVSGKTDGL